MSMTFRARFDAMVAELRGHPRIQVFEAELMPPASPEAIAAAEGAIQRKLPDAMRAFYEAHDGVFLLWGLRGGKYREVARFDFPDLFAAPGCINLLPLETAMSRMWQRESHLNEVDRDSFQAIFGTRFRSFSIMATRLSFAARGIDPDRAERDSAADFDEKQMEFDELRVPDAVVLDNFSKNHVAALLLGPLLGRPDDGSEEGSYSAEDPRVIVARDAGADMTSPDGMSFEAYLDRVLSGYGVERDGFDGEERPTLDQLVDEAVSDPE